jgi:hypothetical protein
MNLQTLRAGIKATHWSWWALWLGSMALLGLTIVNHQGAGMSDLAESFRPQHFPLDGESVMLKGMTKVAACGALVSFVMVFTAVTRPEEASKAMAAAVGVILLYFAIHTLGFMVFAGWRMKAHVRTLTTPAGATVPKQTIPAEK